VSTAVTEQRQTEPRDAFGPGYTIHCLRESFRDLCRQIGKEGARQEIAEIINDEFDGRRQ